MVGKNNRDLKVSKQGTKVETYGIKKFKVGTASVVIGASIFFGAGVAAASEEVANNTTDANTTNAKENAEVKKEEAPKAVAAPKTEAKQATKEEVAAAVAEKVEVKVDGTALNNLISEIKANKEAGIYDSKTEKSVKALEEAVTNAEVTAKIATTQESIDKAFAALTEKIAELKEKEVKAEATEKAETKEEAKTEKTEVAGAKKELEHLVAEGEVLAPAVEKEAAKVENKEVKANLEAVVETVNTKVAEAISVLKNDEATKDDVTKKTGELRSAMEAVVTARTKAGITTPVSAWLADSDEYTVGKVSVVDASDRMTNNVLSYGSNSNGSFIINGKTYKFYKANSASSGSTTLEEALALTYQNRSADGNVGPGIVLRGQNYAGASNGKNARDDYPLSKEDFDKILAERTRWSGDVTASGWSSTSTTTGARSIYEYLATEIYGYVYEQGQDVVITNFSKRFDLKDDAKNAGWKLVGVMPTNFPNGLYYDSATDTIYGKINHRLENGVYDNRTVAFVSDGKETIAYYFASYIVGWIGWKDTTAPTITTTDDITTAGGSLTTNIRFHDNSASATASTDERGGNIGSSNADGTITQGREAQIYTAESQVLGVDQIAGITYTPTTGNLTGTATTAGIYTVSAVAKDYADVPYIKPDGKTDETAEWNQSGQEAQESFTITVRPDVTIGNVVTGATTVPIKVSEGSTQITVTLPDGTTVEAAKGTDNNWLITGGTSSTATVGTNIGSGTSISTPVNASSTTVGVDNISAVVSAENVSATLLVNSINLTTTKSEKVAASFNKAAGRWIVDSVDGNTVTVVDSSDKTDNITNQWVLAKEGNKGRVTYRTNNTDGTYTIRHMEIVSDLATTNSRGGSTGENGYRIFEFTQTFNASGAVTDVETARSDAQTISTAIVVTYDANTNTWKASDGSTVTATPNVKRYSTTEASSDNWGYGEDGKDYTAIRSVTEMTLAKDGAGESVPVYRDSESWIIKTSSGITGVVNRVSNKARDYASVTNTLPTVTATSYDSTLNKTVDLLDSSKVTTADTESTPIVAEVSVTDPSGVTTTYKPTEELAVWTNAKAAVSTAQDAYTQAQTELETAVSAKTAADAAATTKNAELATAQSALESALSEFNIANKIVSEGNLSGAALTAAKKRLTNATTARDTAQSKVNTLTQELSTLHQNVATTQATVSEKLTVANTARADLEEKEDALVSARNAVANAVENALRDSKTFKLDKVGVYNVSLSVIDSSSNETLTDATSTGTTTSETDLASGTATFTEVNATYTITVKAAIVGNNANSEDIQGAKQTGQPTFTFDNTEKSAINQGTKVYTLESTEAKDGDGKTVGTYGIDANGVVTFTPNKDYSGTPTPAKVTLTVTFGNDTTGAPITASATAEYQPVVKPVTPTKQPSETTGPQGKPQTSEIKFDAADTDNTTVNFAKGSVEIDATTTKSIPLNKATVTLLDASGNPTTNPVEVFDAAGKKQGTYTLDKATNIITFQPEADFVGTATPVGVQVADENGTPAKTTYTPTVTEVTLSKEDAKSTAVRGLTQTGKPTFKTSDEKVVIKTIKLIDPTTGNETDNPVVIPNVGTYTMQVDGTVKFVPEPGYVTIDNNKTLVNVRATDENGKSIDAAYEPTVTPIEVTTTPAETIDIQGATQNATPKFELPVTVKDVEVKAGTKVAEITGYKLIDPKDNTAKDEVSVDNVGKYTIDSSTGAVKFEPVATYTGKPTPIEVEATVTVKNEDDKTATFTAKTTYAQEVVPVKPTAQESATAGKQGQKQTSNIVFDTVDRDATTLHFNKGETSRVLNTDGTAKSVELDKDTVVLLNANGDKVTSVTVYEADGTTPQGTYTLTKDAAGNPIIEFQPTPEFTGVAKPVDVEILDLNGTPARTIYTPTVIAEDGSVVVEYIDKDTNLPIAPTETVVNNEKVTTSYTTTPKPIPGYRLVEVKNPEGTTKDDENKVSGKVTNGTTTITYVYEKVKQKATLSYFDITTGTEVAIPSASSEAVEGESNKAIDFADKAATIQALLKAGYEVVTDEFQAATTSDRLFDNDEAEDQNFKVLVKQRILPVTPTTPNVTPGVPVTPTDPANWPESVKDLQKQLTKEVTRTIKYRYIDRTGREASADVVQKVKFTREAKVNIVTGAVEFGAWSKAETLDAVTSPVKDGYTVDRASVDGATVSAESEDSVEYVIYTPVKQKATITYKDETGKVLKVDTVEGNSNTSINYTTKTTLDDLAKQGFTKVRKDEFTKTGGQTFDNDPKVDQEFEVIVAKVTTSYKDEEGKDIPNYPTKDGELPKENIPGYEFVRTEVDPKGNTTHIYKKVPTPTTDKTTSYEDEDGNPLRPTEKGTRTPKDIPGYEFVRTVVDPKGNTTHIYKKVPTPTTDKTTSYVDESGNPLRPTENGTRTPKDIPGYEFVRTVVDPKGNTTHIYKKVPTPRLDVKPLEDVKVVKEKQLPNTSANNTANNNANAAGLGLIGMIAAAIAAKRRKKDNE